MILFYAVMSPARKYMKLNKEVPIRRLEKLEGRTLFSVEPKVRKIGTRQIDDIALCSYVSSS